MKNLIEYFKETKAEIKNVTWPSRTKAVYATIAVLVISVGIAYYLGLFDYLFATGLQWLLLNR
ncbi:MAG: preprotein translocase subunit SecE [Candidatus Pacebacteria bacterium]|nr:preprotein translocase subunit SecE [Candidatus Paceibacterota bacterium]MBP9716097.1 preprotein translocase subunit SecE [Candidatus Paceibacterota bacterium]